MSPDAADFMRSDTSLALRAALVAKDEGRFAEYHHPMYQARWAEPRDLSEREVVRELLSGAGLDADAALARAESDELVTRLMKGLANAESFDEATLRRLRREEGVLVRLTPQRGKKD